MTEVFTKTYPDPDRARTAAHHHQWLADLGAPVPELHALDSSGLLFRHLHGRRAHRNDLPAIASLLGQLHGRAHRTQLHTARLDQDFTTRCGLTLAGFIAPRHARLHRHLQQGLITSGQLHHATGMLAHAQAQHAAFYKDTNIRNVLITRSGPMLVDFDDLTLAPFGYDLAKLLLSAAMTYGHLPSNIYATALAAYNDGVQAEGEPASACPWNDLAQWLELQHLLTIGYLGHNGYRHRWDAVRPWS
ncbi:phosphotransferase [Spiractinospora alimapuensis]|uniref:phosphotransferase n=1 Tax=Spiractinospora alimapuensis TaxID=2820884 RepID=UPI001F3082E1|nr:phosphotransferase [Spiractinospora alimapuensis]QVQ53378.1 phosphotransferase [Spiractinospora alimapuensis]